MQTNPAVEQSKMIGWSDSPWNQSASASVKAKVKRSRLTYLFHHRHATTVSRFTTTSNWLPWQVSKCPNAADHKLTVYAKWSCARFIVILFADTETNKLAKLLTMWLCTFTV